MEKSRLKSFCPGWIVFASVLAGVVGGLMTLLYRYGVLDLRSGFISRKAYVYLQGPVIAVVELLGYQIVLFSPHVLGFSFAVDLAVFMACVALYWAGVLILVRSVGRAVVRGWGRII